MARAPRCAARKTETNHPAPPGGNPIESSTNYIRGEFADLAPALLIPEPIPTGCLGYVESQSGHRATLGADQYAAHPATAEQADALSIRVGEPVLIERHWSTDEDGLVLDYAESAEPGERWRTRRYRIGEPS